MKLTAFSIIFFFICLNLGFYLISELNLFPTFITPTETPTSIQNQTYFQLVTPGAILAAGVIVGILIDRIALGSSVGLLLAVLSFLSPTIQWIVAGFPTFMLAIGVPFAIYTVILTIFMVTFFWFLLGIVAQRYME